MASPFLEPGDFSAEGGNGISIRVDLLHELVDCFLRRLLLCLARAVFGTTHHSMIGIVIGYPLRRSRLPPRTILVIPLSRLDPADDQRIAVIEIQIEPFGRHAI